MNKLKEVLIFFVCVGIILGAAYFTGFLKGFTVSDFKDAYDNIATIVSSGVKSLGVSEMMSTETTAGNQNTTIFKNYKALPIPASALKGHQDSRAWNNIFNSPQKVIFYIYDNDDKNPKYSKDFHNQISSYFDKTKMSRFYNIEPVTLYYFDKLNWGNTGPDKICNSFQECNEYRERAANYSMLSDYLRRCGKTMCIINPRNNQYVMLKTRNAAEAIKMINSIRTW